MPLTVSCLTRKGSMISSSDPGPPATDDLSIADARLIFHHFLSSLAWIHSLYLKACGRPGPLSTARPSRWPADSEAPLRSPH